MRQQNFEIVLVWIKGQRKSIDEKAPAKHGGMTDQVMFCMEEPFYG